MYAQMDISVINILDYEKFIIWKCCIMHLFFCSSFVLQEAVCIIRPIRHNMWQLFDDLPNHGKEAIARNHRNLASHWETLAPEFKR